MDSHLARNRSIRDMGTLAAYERIKNLGRGASGTVSLMVRKSDNYACAVKHIGASNPTLYGAVLCQGLALQRK